MSLKRSLYLKHIAKTSPGTSFVEVERTEGVYVIDADGKKHFDLASGIGPSILGHHHPDILSAIEVQSKSYLHTMVYGMHIQSPQVDLGVRILEFLPDTFEQVYFLSSGSEAIEAALKMAKLSTGRKGIFAAENAYHGSTIGAESLRSDNDFLRNLAPVVPGVRHVRFNEHDDLQRIDDRTACVIMEPVQAEAGIIVPTDNFLKKVRERCNEVGALLIFDEIQMGMGRTGSLFACQKFDVYPDILVLGKAIGGGLPLSAVITSKSIAQSMSHKFPLSHLTTFGGHPLCCATGLAAFNVIANERLWERAEVIGSLYTSLLSDKITKWKQYGAMFGIELKDVNESLRFQELLLKQGVISDLLLFNERMVRMAPPLVISNSEIEESAERILAAYLEL